MFACIGHWYTSGLYLIPVAGLVGFLKVSSWRAKRAERTQAGTTEAPAAPVSASLVS